jgi:hypothetical protein
VHVFNHLNIKLTKFHNNYESALSISLKPILLQFIISFMINVLNIKFGWRILSNKKQALQHQSTNHGVFRHKHNRLHSIGVCIKVNVNLFTVHTYYSHLFYHYASLCGYHRFIVTGNWMQNSPWSNRAILIISWELRSHICPIGTYFYLKQNTSETFLSKPIWAMISKLGADYLRGSTLYIDLLSGLFSMLQPQGQKLATQ